LQAATRQHLKLELATAGHYLGPCRHGLLGDPQGFSDCALSAEVLNYICLAHGRD